MYQSTPNCPRKQHTAQTITYDAPAWCCKDTPYINHTTKHRARQLCKSQTTILSLAPETCGLIQQLQVFMLTQPRSHAQVSIHLVIYHVMTNPDAAGSQLDHLLE